MKIVLVTKEASILAFYSILKTTFFKRNNESIINVCKKWRSQNVPCPHIKEGISQLKVDCLNGPEPRSLLVLRLLTAAIQSTMKVSYL